MASTRYIRFFGGVQIEIDGQPVRGRAAHRRRLALLAILAHHGPTGATRERLADLLWGERDAERGRRLLSEALFVLRKEFGANSIVAAGEQLVLNAEHIPNDVNRLRAAAANGDAELAVATYVGPFLDGWFVDDAPEFENWAGAGRQEYARQHADLLLTATDRAERDGDWARAARWLRYVVDLDPVDERAARRLSGALHRSGDRTGALRVLEQLRRALAAELGTTPDAVTRALEHSLRESDHDATPMVSRTAHAVPPAAVTATIASSTDATVRSPTTRPTSVRRGLRTGMVGVALLGTVSVLGWSMRSRIAVQEPVRSRTFRIGLLPFSMPPGDSAARVLADASAQAIIVDLSTASRMTMVSRTAIEGLVRQPLSLDSVGRQLDLDYVIEGAVTRIANELTLNVRLTDPRSGGVVALTSHTPVREGPIENVDALGATLTAPLRRRLGREALRAVAHASSIDPRAIAALTAARIARADASDLFSGPSDEDLTSAQQLLQQADSLLTEARRLERGWARAALDQGWLRFEQGLALRADERRSRMRSALAIADSLLARDTSAEVMTLRGTVLVRLASQDGGEGKKLALLDSANLALRGATSIDSTDARAWAALSHSAWLGGRMGDAVIAGERALRHDPFLQHAPEVLYRMFNASLIGREYDAARSSCRRGRAIVASDWRFTECRLRLMPHVGGTPVAAWALVDTLNRLDPPAVGRVSDHPYSHVYRRLVAALMSARAGDRVTAEREMRAMTARVETDPAMRLDILPDLASIHAALGDSTAARRRMADYLAKRPAMRKLYEQTLMRWMLEPAVTQ
jgi:DNA-binding SARP family transcriptional activator/TolB-like protein